MSDLVDLVPMAEFAYNNSRTTATGHSLFYVNYGFYRNSGTSQTRTDTLPVSSQAYGHWTMAIHDNFCNTLENTHDTMKNYADSDRAERPKYSKCGFVMLSAQNIRTHRPCKNLDHKVHGPVKVTTVSSETSMHLNLPLHWKIHKVFHISLLEGFIHRNQYINLEKAEDAAHPIEADE
jgi:hypothetical protein